MDRWTSESSPGKQTAAAIGCAAVGLVLVVGFRHFSGPGLTDSKAGFLLGLLLLGIGVAGLLTQGRQRIVVDPSARLVTIEDQTPIGARRKTIPFDGITGVSIGYLGKRSNLVGFYYLVLHLRSGKEVSLFAPGRFYEGASDRFVVEGWRHRLEGYLGARTAAAEAPGGHLP
jgi:hypothetical protein